MSDHQLELCARLAMHEFLLEQIFANGAMSSPNPSENWNGFSASLIDSARYGAYTKNDSPETHEMQKLVIEMTEHFCEKVAVRVEQGYK